MREVYGSSYANPSSIHQEGVAARRLIEAAREHVAGVLQVRPEGVVFTAGGTEANNLAVFGVVEAARVAGVEYEDMEVITTKLEHPSLLLACEALVAKGVTVHYAPVDEGGKIILSDFADLVNEKTALMATAYVNSEIGVIQPIRKLRKLLKEKSDGVMLVDGAQGPLWLPCQLDHVGADVMTFDAGKMYGPKGCGAIVMRHGVELGKSVFGGRQEQGLRPGTENPALIIGLEHALSIAQQNQSRRAEGVKQLRDYFMSELEQLDGVVINGEREERVANNVNISVPGLDTEFAVISLDEKGVACGTKSACSGAGGGQSTVVMTISGDTARASSTIRFTLGETNNKHQVDVVVAILREHIEKVTKIG